MHIGVDATCWQNNRGYGRHARALLRALVQIDSGNRYTLVLDSTEGLNTLPCGAEVKIVGASTPTALSASARGHRSVYDMCRMSRALSDPSFDLLLYPTVYSYVPSFSRAKKVVMIHDIIAEMYPDLALSGPAARLLWWAKVALGRRQADAIATVSEYSRKALVLHFGLSPEQVHVVGEAGDSSFRVLDNPRLSPHLLSLGLTPGGRTVVYVGGFSPHKNLERLVSAFARLVQQEEFSDVRLVMVGENEREVFHSYFSTVKTRVEELGIADGVLFTGYLPDEELVALLNLSTVLVLPSLMEGFGLPAVEAAACGCPVIATTASPLPSLLGDGGLYVDPLRPEELTAALARVLESDSLRREMGAAALSAARRLTWEAAARQMITVLEKVGTP